LVHIAAELRYTDTYEERVLIIAQHAHMQNAQPMMKVVVFPSWKAAMEAVEAYGKSTWSNWRRRSSETTEKHNSKLTA
jgi:hypothetical protein